MSKALNNAAKLAQEVWVDEDRWGVVGDGSADDTAALQACITANAGKTIYFGPNTYRITAPLVLTSNNTRLIGQHRKTLLLNQGTGDALHFQCVLTGQFDYLSGCALKGFYILRNTHTATAGAGLRLTRCSSFVGEDFYILDCPEGLKIHGGQLNKVSNFQVFASTSMIDVSATADTNLVGFYESETTTSVFQPLFTLRLSDFQVSGDNKVDTAWLMSAGDGLEIVNGYVSKGKNSNLKITQYRNSAYISPVQITNVYFDGVNTTTGSVYCLNIPDDGFTSVVSAVVFSNCFFGQPQSTIARIRKGAQLEFASCIFANGTGWAIDSENSGARVVVTGGKLSNMGTAVGATGGIRMAGGHTLSVTGMQFNADSGTVASIRLEGTIGGVSLTGNSFRSTTADISNAATITDFTYAGNNSDKSAAGSSLLGVKLNNTAITDTTVLDWYEEGTFTPTVSFNNASVGVSYTTQDGTFTRIGNRVIFELELLLANKGSSTGVLAVGGLPYNAAKTAAVSAWVNTITSGVGDTAVQAILSAGASSIRIDKILVGFSNQLTDVDVTNTTRFRIGGSYRV